MIRKESSEDSEDDFFGDQLSDDEYYEANNNNNTPLSTTHNLNPQDGDEEVTTATIINTLVNNNMNTQRIDNNNNGNNDGLSIRTQSTLSKYEERSQEKRFHNLGYHEAYDEHKDSKLQIGFEDGYKQNFESSIEIGKLLGQAICLEQEQQIMHTRCFAKGESINNEVSNNHIDSTVVDDCDDEKSKIQRQNKLFNNNSASATIVRKYLEDEQVKDGSTMDRTNEQRDFVIHELNTLVNERKQQEHSKTPLN